MADTPVGSAETKRAFPGIQWLKTPYRSTISDSRKGDLNLIQLQKVIETDVSKVAQISGNLNCQRLFMSNSLFYDTNND